MNKCARKGIIALILAWTFTFVCYIVVFVLPQRIYLARHGYLIVEDGGENPQLAVRNVSGRVRRTRPPTASINDPGRNSPHLPLTIDPAHLNPMAKTIQEFNYQPFDIHTPLFTEDSDKNTFLKGICYNEVLKSYKGDEKLQGKIMVVRNGIYRMPYDCGYLSKIKPLMDISWLRGSKFTVTRYDKLIIMIIPDGWSFQHFLDGTLPKLVQALPLIRQTPGIKLLLDREPRDHIVFEILQKLGFDVEKDIVYAKRNVIVANELYSTCCTPPLHPKLWQDAQRLLGVYNPDPVVDQLVPQDKVIFLNRNPKNSFNKGRMVLNNDDVIAFLQKRYGDKFLAYDSKLAGGLNHTVEAFRKARVIIGVHGGGMYNIQFARRGAHVIEIVPVFGDGRYVLPRCMVYVIANLLEQNYWHTTMKTARNNGDLYFDIAKLTRTLDKIDGTSARTVF